MKKGFKGFIIGMITTILIMSTVVYGDDYSQKLSVLVNSVKLAIDGDVVADKGESYQLSNGDEVPFTLLYNGTTYLPIRKVSEIFGKEIGWDNATETVYLGEKPGATTSHWTRTGSKWVTTDDFNNSDYYYSKIDFVEDGLLNGSFGHEGKDPLKFGFSMSWTPSPAVLEPGSQYTYTLDANLTEYSDPENEYAYPLQDMTMFYGFELNPSPSYDAYKPLRYNYISEEFYLLDYGNSYVKAITAPDAPNVTDRDVYMVAPEHGDHDNLYIVSNFSGYGYWVYTYEWSN